MLRFGQIFAVLLGMCFLSAFVLPRSSTRVKGGVDAVLYPVARPAGAIARALRDRLVRTPAEPGAVAEREAAEENQRLKAELAALTMQYELLQARVADRERLGDIRKDCISYAVMAPETTGRRQVLKLSPSAVLETKQDQFVFFPPRGIAGRMMKGGAVQLITDDGFPGLTGSFGDFRQRGQSGATHWVAIATPPALVKGAGHGLMVVDSLRWKDVSESGLKKGDWVILNDAAWPLAVQGWPIGRVGEAPQPRPDAPMFALIKIHPLTNLVDLQEVMVMNKK